MLEVRVSVWNGRFGGTTDVYISHSELSDAANSLAGFPQTLTDAREFQLGSFGPQYGGGASAIRLWCADGAGHVRLQARIESDFNQTATAESATLFAGLEPSAIDSFVAELRQVELTHAGTAALRIFDIG
jgi:hypothetical protein